jgi:hypothetical protein
MQRRESKIGLRDRKGHRRPKESNDTNENPHRNGLSTAGARICGFVGLDGGVRSQMRTGLHPKFPANSENYREFLKIGPLSDFSYAKPHGLRRLRYRFPTQNNRENNYRIRENFAQEQGCFRNLGGGRREGVIPPPSIASQKMGMFPSCRSVSVGGSFWRYRRAPWTPDRHGDFSAQL